MSFEENDCKIVGDFSEKVFYLSIFSMGRKLRSLVDLFIRTFKRSNWSSIFPVPCHKCFIYSILFRLGGSDTYFMSCLAR